MSDLDAIRDRIDIVELVGETVQLQRSGRTYKGLCPFHSERTPSFIVSPERRTWHCFGSCATGGDVFSFIMRRDNAGFGEAVRLLATRAGIELSGPRARPDPLVPRLIAANEAAAGFFHHLLLNSTEGEAARAYAEQRGLSGDVIREFEVGYAPDSWDALATSLMNEQFKAEELVEAGLLIQGERGLHDRFRARLMFPIRESDGKVVGFGGRALGDGTPKYLNSPQTRVFDKGGLLYALDRAAATIRHEGTAVIVEGYLDAITAHQFGYRNVVATLGTALGEKHIGLVRRYTRSVVLALDADPAGLEAALRGERVLRETVTDDEGEVTIDVGQRWRQLIRVQSRAPVDVRIFSVPTGKDPDEAIRAEPAAWPAWVASAQPPFEFRLRTELARLDRSNPRARLEMLDRMVPLLAAVDDRALQAHYVVQLADTLHVAEEVVRARLNALLPAARSGQDLVMREAAGSKPAVPTASGARAERFCLALLLRFDELRRRGEAIDAGLFESAAHRELFEHWRSGQAADEETIPEEVRAVWLALLDVRMMPAVVTDPGAALENCARRMLLRRVEDQKRLLTATISDGTAPPAEGGADEPDAPTAPEWDLESTLREDMEVGQRLHRLEYELRTGRAPREPASASEPPPRAEQAPGV